MSTLEVLVAARKLSLPAFGFRNYWGLTPQCCLFKPSTALALCFGCLEAAIGIEPMNKGFADLCLTTWLRRRKRRKKRRKDEENSFSFQCSVYSSTEPPFSGNTENQKLKIYSSSFRLRISRIWSGRRDLNSRPSPWQGDALPLSYSRLSKKFDSND